MIRVLHILTTLDPGGAELQTLHVISRLPRERFACEVAYLKGAGGLAERYEMAGIPVHRLGLRGLLDAPVFRRAHDLCRAVRPDIVHTHLMKADVVGAVAARLARVPFVVATKHNEDRYLRHPGLRVAARAAAELADRTVVVSDAVGRFFVRTLSLAPADLVRIRHGLPPEDSPAPPEAEARADVRREFALPAEATVALTVARLSEQKGLTDLVRAASLLAEARPELRFLVAGRGEDEAALRDLATRLDVADRVRFAGYRGDIPRLMAAADLFVLPSRWEGFGLVLLEAMRAARAVVATRIGGIPEVVVDGETGLLVHYEEGEPRGFEAGLAEAVNELVADPERARAMGRAGRERAVTTFGWDAVARQTLEVYRRVL
ncbi:MAG: glycosyltransferase [Actinomycetia bacterium]|nr:glycosyltransferase [Actinomycetes bacterium]